MIKVFNIDIYRHSVILLYQENKDNVEKYIKHHYKSIDSKRIDILKNYIDDVDCERCGGVEYNINNLSFIILKEDRFNDVTHECFHAVNSILQDCGVELTECGEAYAYLMGYVSSLVFTEIDKFYKSKNA